LEQRPRHEETAPFAVRELPPGLANHLHEACRHALEQIPEAQLAAESFGLLEVSLLGRPPPAKQQVEGERPRQHVVLVQLWGRRDAASPPRSAERAEVEPAEQQERRAGLANARRESRKRPLASSRGALDEEPRAMLHAETAP